eukprot:TRINITY_DN23135_c0_g1_i4.p1 TRINITY_DN23135_c0_g1~~TRINITY_DN23135_c0_g1_i4.p1  ORF type:complete len:1125 (+),score=267.35 TRINITY_DN23135_c0_g1_i4:169-3543(+)
METRSVWIRHPSERQASSQVRTGKSPPAKAKKKTVVRRFAEELLNDPSQWPASSSISLVHKIAPVRAFSYMDFHYVLKIQRRWRKALVQKRCLLVATDLSYCTRTPCIEEDKQGLFDIEALIEAAASVEQAALPKSKLGQHPWDLDPNFWPEEMVKEREEVKKAAATKNASKNDTSTRQDVGKKAITTAAASARALRSRPTVARQRADGLRKDFVASVMSEKLAAAEFTKLTMEKQSAAAAYNAQKELETDTANLSGDFAAKLANLRAQAQNKQGKLEASQAAAQDAKERRFAFDFIQWRFRCVTHKKELWPVILEKWKEKQKLVLWLQRRYRGAREKQAFKATLQNRAVLILQTKVRGKQAQWRAHERLGAEQTRLHRERSAFGHEDYLASRLRWLQAASLWMQTRYRGVREKRELTGQWTSPDGNRLHAILTVQKIVLKVQSKYRRNIEVSNAMYKKEKKDDRTHALKGIVGMIQRRFRGVAARQQAAEKKRILKARETRELEEECVSTKKLEEDKTVAFVAPELPAAGGTGSPDCVTAFPFMDYLQKPEEEADVFRYKKTKGLGNEHAGGFHAATELQPDEEPEPVAESLEVLDSAVAQLHATAAAMCSEDEGRSIGQPGSLTLKQQDRDMEGKLADSCEAVATDNITLASKPAAKQTRHRSSRRSAKNGSVSVGGISSRRSLGAAAGVAEPSVSRAEEVQQPQQPKPSVSRAEEVQQPQQPKPSVSRAEEVQQPQQPKPSVSRAEEVQQPDQPKPSVSRAEEVQQPQQRSGRSSETRLQRSGSLVARERQQEPGSVAGGREPSLSASQPAALTRAQPGSDTSKAAMSISLVPEKPQSRSETSPSRPAEKTAQRTGRMSSALLHATSTKPAEDAAGATSEMYNSTASAPATAHPSPELVFTQLQESKEELERVLGELDLPPETYEAKTLELCRVLDDLYQVKMEIQRGSGLSGQGQQHIAAPGKSQTEAGSRKLKDVTCIRARAPFAMVQRHVQALADVFGRLTEARADRDRLPLRQLQYLLKPPQSNTTTAASLQQLGMLDVMLGKMADKMPGELLDEGAFVATWMSLFDICEAEGSPIDIRMVLETMYKNAPHSRRQLSAASYAKGVACPLKGRLDTAV